MEKLESTKWRQIDDFIPLLAIPVTILNQLNPDDIKRRVYELSEQLAVRYEIPLSILKRLHF